MSSVPVSPPHCCGGDASAAPQGSDQSLLASDRYARLILAQINKMRLRSDFCDVRLKVGGRVFGVHRLVLAASSPYFSALFSGGMSEVDQEEVQILGVDTRVFEMLLDFIYTGRPRPAPLVLLGLVDGLVPSGAISVSVDNVQELMVAADMLQLQEVVAVCGEFLKAHMDPSNCVGVFQFLEHIACLDMLEFTENYIHVHFLEVRAPRPRTLLLRAEIYRPGSRCASRTTSGV